MIKIKQKNKNERKLKMCQQDKDVPTFPQNVKAMILPNILELCDKQHFWAILTIKSRAINLPLLNKSASETPGVQLQLSSH